MTPLVIINKEDDCSQILVTDGLTTAKFKSKSAFTEQDVSECLTHFKFAKKIERRPPPYILKYHR